MAGKIYKPQMPFINEMEQKKANTENSKISSVPEKTIVDKKKYTRLKEFYEQHPHGREKLTLGQKLADIITTFGGSWAFIFFFMVFLFVWIGVNLYFLLVPPDPYPFILLNLMLSCLAALQAPVILMSQNRQSERDRIKAERDHYVNRKAEREIANMQQDLDEIKELIHSIHTNTDHIKSKL